MTFALVVLAALLWFPPPDPVERAGLRERAPSTPASRRPLLPHALLLHRARTLVRAVTGSRTRRPSLDIAWTLDLLAGCLRAGLPASAALSAVADIADDDVAEPLAASAARLELWAPDPWEPMAADPGLSEAAALARRSGNSGAPLAEGFAELAERARASVSDEAEATAQRAGVLISAPLGLCFLPAFVFLGLVPVIVGLAGPMFGGA